MRVGVTAESDLTAAFLARYLRDRGVPAEFVPQAEVADLVADVVVLHRARWDEAAAAAVAALAAHGATVLVVCGDAGAARGRILAAGAAEAFADGAYALRALLAAVRWRVEQRWPGRVRLGPLLFDPVEGELLARAARVKLTDTERRLLWRLHVARLVGGPAPLTAERLAAALGTTATAVRNHVQHLREKAEGMLGAPPLLGHDPARGYHLQLDPPSDPPPPTGEDER